MLAHKVPLGGGSGASSEPEPLKVVTPTRRPTPVITAPPVETPPPAETPAPAGSTDRSIEWL